MRPFLMLYVFHMLMRIETNTAFDRFALALDSWNPMDDTYTFTYESLENPFWDPTDDESTQSVVVKPNVTDVIPYNMSKYVINEIMARLYKLMGLQNFIHMLVVQSNTICVEFRNYRSKLFILHFTGWLLVCCRVFRKSWKMLLLHTITLLNTKDGSVEYFVEQLCFYKRCLIA